MTGVGRRQVLATLGAGALALAGCGDGRKRSLTAAEGLLGEGLAMNVHPLGGSFEALQHDALRALGTPWIRVPLGLTRETGAAASYVGAGPSVLGLVADAGWAGSLDPGAFPALVAAALRRYPQVRRAEILNDPERVHGLSPERYVREFLGPASELIRRSFPGVAVVAAAPSGDRRRGPASFRRMTDAGADELCDYRAARVLFEDAGALDALAGATGRPILVTETGTSSPGHHVRWHAEVIPRIRGTLGAELVFWYVLLESAALAGGPVAYSYPGYSLIAGTPDATGHAQGAPGSGLYALLTGRAQRPRR